MYTSNLRQRQRAQFQAAALILLLMLLTGIGGALYPLSNHLETIESRGHAAGELAALQQLRRDCDTLIGWMQKADGQLNDAMALDNRWSKAATYDERGALKEDIVALENRLLQLVVALKQQATDTMLTTRVAQTYSQWLTARTAIWGLRTTPPPPPPVPSGGADPAADCKQALGECRADARSIADRLDRKADDIDKKINDVSGRRDRQDKVVLREYADHLRSLARELRNIGK
jgi:hypothetical protein